MANKLQKQFQSFVCQCRTPINKFCLDNTCKEQSAFCEQCELQKHRSHRQMVFSIEKLIFDIIENNNLNEKMGRVIRDINEICLKQVKQLEIKQQQLQIDERINDENIQTIFGRLKEQIEICGNTFQYKKQLIEDLQIPIKQLNDNLNQIFKKTPEFFKQSQVKEIKNENEKEKEKLLDLETPTPIIYSQILNDPQLWNGKELLFGVTECSIHFEVIDRICFCQECDKQRLLCEKCEKDHRVHRGKVINYESLRDDDHLLNRVKINQDIFQKLQLLFDQFENNVSQIMPHELLLQYIDQAITKKELQQNIHKLSNNIQFGKQNEIIIQIITENEFYSYYQNQITSFLSQLSDYWKQEPQSQPLQEQFQYENNVPLFQIIAKFSKYNLSQNLQIDHNQNIYKMNDSVIIFQLKYTLFDVGCLDVSVEKYNGPYIFEIKKLTGIIGIGFARLDQLQKNNFQLEGIDRIDMITSDRVSYNSSDQQYNNKDSCYEIKQYQKYKLTFNKSKKGLDFVIENYENSKKRFQMEVQYNQEFQYVVFVLIHKQDSQIQILE